jgi:hypothetical protein
MGEYIIVAEIQSQIAECNDSKPGEHKHKRNGNIIINGKKSDSGWPGTRTVVSAWI